MLYVGAGYRDANPVPTSPLANDLNTVSCDQSFIMQIVPHNCTLSINFNKQQKRKKEEDLKQKQNYRV